MNTTNTQNVYELIDKLAAFAKTEVDRLNKSGVIDSALGEERPNGEKIVTAVALKSSISSLALTEDEWALVKTFHFK